MRECSFSSVDDVTRSESNRSALGCRTLSISEGAVFPLGTQIDPRSAVVTAPPPPGAAKIGAPPDRAPIQSPFGRLRALRSPSSVSPAIPREQPNTADTLQASNPPRFCPTQSMQFAARLSPQQRAPD